MGAKKKPLPEARGHDTLVLREKSFFSAEKKLQEARGRNTLFLKEKHVVGEKKKTAGSTRA